jgi:hypothetical protein
MSESNAQVEPFGPIVESLLGRPLDSPEFLDTAEVAGPAEIDEALRQLRQQIEWVDERLAEIKQELEQLEDGNY